MRGLFQNQLCSRFGLRCVSTRAVTVRSPGVRWRRYGIAALAAAVVSCSADRAHASYLWEPRVQFTHAGADSSHVAGDFLYGQETGGGEYYHLAFREWSQCCGTGDNYNNATGYYLRLPKNAQWPDAWSDAWADREQFTRQNVGQTNSMSDQRMVIDDEGDVHVVYETKAYVGFPFGTGIGYKRRGVGTPIALWDKDHDPIQLSGPADTTCGGVSPRLFLKRGEGTTPDSLHVIFSANYDSGPTPDCIPAQQPLHRVHIAREIGTEDDAWSAASVVVTEPKLADQFVIDGNGKFHFLDAVTIIDENPCVVRVLHAAADPPSGGLWSLGPMDVLDEWEIPCPPPPVSEESTSELPPEILQDGDRLYFIWNSSSAAIDGADVRLSELDTSDPLPENWVWDPPLQGSFPYGIAVSNPQREARGGSVLINDDGVMHLTYHEPAAGNLHPTNHGEGRIFHRTNGGDPMDLDDWSAPTEISSDRRTDAKRPSIITDEDSVWVTYTIHDDDDAGQAPDQGFEGWARRGYPIADGVASGERADWFGSVFVDADFVVAAGGTLSVAPGTKIFARADQDRENQGKEPTLTEIIVRGTFLAQAAGLDPIVFTSYDDDGQGADEWGGFLFQLQGTYESSYGFYATLEPPSSLANVSIENAKYGVRIDGRIAPGLDDVTFTNISSGADIYLDESDVVVAGFRYEGDDEDPLTWDYSPELTRWDLTGPTTVVSTTTIGSGDSVLGLSGKLDLIVQGDLDTQQGAGGEPVTFTSASPDAANGDDWAGIFIDWSAAGCTIDHADIGYAHTGVFAISPDDLKLRDSCIHNCNDIAVHIWYSGVGGVTLEGNTIERGSTMHPQKGNECLVLENVDACTIEGNLIDLGFIQDSSPVAPRNGLRIQNSKFFCQNTNPPGPRLQSITGNRIVGPGASADAATGILADWACGTGQRDVEISGNYIDGWSSRAVWIKEGLDVDVSCNAIVGNKAGVHFDRDKYNSAWPPVRFRGNRIDPAPSLTTAVGTRTTNALAIDYGPTGSGTTGDNSLFQWLNQSFVVENDPNTANVMDARNNAWFIDGTLNDMTSAIATYITSEITDPPDVYIASPKNDEGTPCYPSEIQAGCGESQSRNHGGGVVATRNDAVGASPMVGSRGEPLVTALEAPRPNPGSRGTTIVLVVANPAEPFQVDVFDVRGRRLARLVDGIVDAGRHQLVWSGRDERGRPAAPGVYFVRAVSTSYTRTQKVVLVK